MKLSININAYQDKGFVRQILLGIEKLNLDFDYEVMVIDAGGCDGTAQMVRENFPKVKIYESFKNLGHHKGHNIGFKNSTGKYILTLNADIVFLNDTISPLIDFLDAHHEVALVSPKLINPDKSDQDIPLHYTNFWTPFYRRTFWGNTKRGKFMQKKLLNNNNLDYSRPVERVQGSFMMIRRSALEKVNFFDERFFLYLGDEDLCRKFWDAGFKVYFLSEVRAVHYYHRESQVPIFFSLFHKVSRWHLQDWLKYLWKYRGRKKQIFST